MPSYNNIESIDKLIERLEVEMRDVDTSSPEVRVALDERKEKLNRLRELKEEHSSKTKESEIAKKLREENKELDKAINGLERMISKVSPSYVPSESRGSLCGSESRRSSCGSESRGYSYRLTPSYDSSESRYDSSESREGLFW